MEPAPILSPFPFAPPPLLLIEGVLRRKIAGDHPNFVAGFNITDADVYSTAPYNLVADGVESYFFHDFSSSVNNYGSASGTKKRPRAVASGMGSWHTEQGRKEVRGSNGVYKSKFSFRQSRGMPEPEERWLMTEYAIKGSDIVIARIYKSPRPRRWATNMASSSSTASTWSLGLHQGLINAGQAIPPLLLLPYTAGQNFAPTVAPGQYYSDAGTGLVNVPAQYYPDYCMMNLNNDASQAMATSRSPTAPPPLLPQGTGHYPDVQHVTAAAAAAGQDAVYYPDPDAGTGLVNGPAQYYYYMNHNNTSQEMATWRTPTAPPPPTPLLPQGTGQYPAAEHVAAAAAGQGVDNYAAAAAGGASGQAAGHPTVMDYLGNDDDIDLLCWWSNQQADHFSSLVGPYAEQAQVPHLSPEPTVVVGMPAAADDVFELTSGGLFYRY